MLCTNQSFLGYYEADEDAMSVSAACNNSVEKYPNIHKTHFHPNVSLLSEDITRQRAKARQPEIRWNRHLSDQRFRTPE